MSFWYLILGGRRGMGMLLAYFFLVILIGGIIGMIYQAALAACSFIGLC